MGGFDDFVTGFQKITHKVSFHTKKWPLFSNFQVQMDSPSAMKNAYLLCLNRRYIIHFQ